MYGRMYGWTYGWNEHPYVMRLEVFGPLGADAQKEEIAFYLYSNSSNDACGWPSLDWPLSRSKVQKQSQF
jgi:hypothetical protein